MVEPSREGKLSQGAKSVSLVTGLLKAMEVAKISTQEPKPFLTSAMIQGMVLADDGMVDSPTERRSTTTIVPAQPRAQDPGRKTLFDYPGEIRNYIYAYALDMDREFVPLPPDGIGKTTHSAIPLLQSCSMVFHECRGLLANNAMAYIPLVVVEKDEDQLTKPQHNALSISPWTSLDSKYSQPTTDTEETIARAMAEFMNIQFHLHVDAEFIEMLDTNMLKQNIRETLGNYMSHSQAVSKKHQWRYRRATLHLDYFVYRWARWSPRKMVGFYSDLVDFLAQDINTMWEVRYYAIPHPQDTDEQNSLFRHCDVKLLRACCRKYNNVTVLADDNGYERDRVEDWSIEVASNNMPRTELWVACNRCLAWGLDEKGQV